MKAIPLPVLMFLAALFSSTGTGLVMRWISWFSHFEVDPAAVYMCMGVSGFIGSASVAVARLE